MKLQLAQKPGVHRPDGRVIELGPLDAALMAWLALEGPTPRAQLAALLWPESTPEAARNTLRQRLFQLRKTLGGDVVTGQNTLQLAPGVTHDLADGYAVLAGVDIDVGGDFAAWLVRQRDQRLTAHLQNLQLELDLLEQAGRFDAALVLAQGVLRLAPLSESAHRRLMRLHYLAGDQAAALLAFDHCERVLKAEVGARPGEQTLQLLSVVQQAVPLAAPAPGSVLPAGVMRPPRLIGRAAELAVLTQAWACGQVVAISGEAGMGKTRLLQTFAGSRGDVVHAAARPGDAGIPFGTLARLLRAVLSREVATGYEMGPTLRSEVSRVLPEMHGALPGLVREGTRLAMQRAVRHLLHEQTGLCGLLLDDLHFADEASLEMLLALIDDEGRPMEQRGLKWAIAYRPADARTPLAALQDVLTEQAQLQRLSLKPLAESDLVDLVDSMQLPGIAGARLATPLMQRTGGNPLFVLETLKQAWVDDRLTSLAVPQRLPRVASLNLLIERRIGMLTPSALALARVASIAGVDFSVPLAEIVLGVSAMHFADALNELESAQVMRGNSFAHDLVFDAVLASVPGTIAMHTHGQVAIWLEAHGGEPARIARHWIDAQQGIRALPWLAQAADAARRALRSKEGVAFLETKSAIEAEAGQAEAAFDSLFDAADEFMDTDLEADTSLRYCDRLDAMAVTPRQRVLALIQRAHFHQQRGEFEACERHGRVALREAMSSGDRALLALAQRQVGAACLFTKRSADALTYLQAAMGWYDAHGSDEQRSEIHGELAVLYDNSGRLEEARPHHQIGFDLARKAGKFSNASASCGNFACNRLDAGDLGAAEDSLQQGQQLLAAYDDFGAGSGLLQMLRALALAHLGRYGQALTQAELGLDSAQRYQPGHLSFAHLRLALVWSHLGQWARVTQQLALVSVGDDTPASVRVQHARLTWYAARAAGRGVAVAREALAAELRRIDGEDRPDLRLPMMLELADATVPETALSQIAQVAREAQRMNHTSTVLAAHIRAAEVAAAHDSAAARREADAALALASQGRHTTVLLPSELWLHAGRAYSAAGDSDSACAVLTQGRDWVLRTARDEVPESFRDSFMQRNPVNRDLLALAKRLVA